MLRQPSQERARIEELSIFKDHRIRKGRRLSEAQPFRVGGFETEATAGGSDSVGPPESGKRDPESRFRITTIRPLRVADQATGERRTSARAKKRPISFAGD